MIKNRRFFIDELQEIEKLIIKFVILSITFVLVAALDSLIHDKQSEYELFQVLFFLFIQTVIIIVVMKNTIITRIRSNFFTILDSIVIAYAITMIILSIYVYIVGDYSSANETILNQQDKLAVENGYYFNFLTIIISAPLYEEFFYRLFPMLMARFFIEGVCEL